MTPEGEVLKAVRDWLDWHKVFYFRINQIPVPTQNGFRRFTGMAGVPDIIAVLRGGIFCGLECKREGGKQSPSQKEFETNVGALGGLYFVIHSTDDLETHLSPYL